MNALLSEKIRKPPSGYLMLFVSLAILTMAILFFKTSLPPSPPEVCSCSLFVIVLTKGLLVFQPNTAKVFLLFGAYRGSVRSKAFWVNPFTVVRPCRCGPAISKASS